MVEQSPIPQEDPRITMAKKTLIDHGLESFIGQEVVVRGEALIAETFAIHPKCGPQVLPLLYAREKLEAENPTRVRIESILDRHLREFLGIETDNPQQP